MSLIPQMPTIDQTTKINFEGKKFNSLVFLNNASAKIAITDR
jgi:hypothetical protein